MMTNFHLRLSRFIREKLDKPYQSFTEEDFKKNGMELARALHEVKAPIFDLVCDYTNNSLENISKGIITVSIVLKTGVGE